MVKPQWERVGAPYSKHYQSGRAHVCYSYADMWRGKKGSWNAWAINKRGGSLGHSEGHKTRDEAERAALAFLETEATDA